MKLFLQHIFLLLSIICIFIYLIVLEKHSLFLIGVEFAWLCNIFYSLRKIKRKIIFLLFNLMIQFFLLNGPLLGMLKGYVWYMEGDDNTRFALSIILLSLYSLYVGGLIGDSQIVSYINKTTLKYRTCLREASQVPKGRGNSGKQQLYQNIQFISGIFFCISIWAVFLLGAEKIIFRLSHGYIDYYASFQSRLPYVISILAIFSEYALCAYLAAYPPKKRALPVLILYWLAAIPELIVGQRNPIMLRAIFVVVYFVIRDFCSFQDKWFGRFEKGVLTIGVPASLVLVGVVGNIRNFGAEKIRGVFNILFDLLYYQGNSFMWLAKAKDVLPDIHKNLSFTFGGFVDYFQYGGFAKLFSGSSGLEAGNNVMQATLSNNLAHHLSYVLLGEEYLDGAGTGSSYILEVYIDFGYTGVIIFNLVLGFFLIYGIKIMKKNFLLNVIGLMCLTELFFIPRAEATGFLTFIMVPYFWFVLAVCYGGALLMQRKWKRYREVKVERKASV